MKINLPKLRSGVNLGHPKKRKILLLDEGYVAQFEQEFKEKVQR